MRLTAFFAEFGYLHSYHLVVGGVFKGSHLAFVSLDLVAEVEQFDFEFFDVATVLLFGFDPRWLRLKFAHACLFKF